MIRICFFSFFLILILGQTGCSDKKESTQNIDSQSVSKKKMEIAESIVASKDSTAPQIIQRADLSSEFPFKGDFEGAYTWYDLNGKNILILSTSSEVKVIEDIGEEEKTKELFARHYVKRKPETKPELLWELYDLEKACIFDLSLAFLQPPIITDLDNDKTKETTLLYSMACRSDVSPSRMKIVIHENKDKYALRGSRYIPMNPEKDTLDILTWEPDLSKLSIEKDDFMGYWGRYENTKDFAGAPPSFLEHARKLWLENFIE